MAYGPMGSMHHSTYHFSPIQIVITNELTTRIYRNGDSILVPALGDSHSHRVNYQIIVGRDNCDDEMFVAKIKKSFWMAEKMIPFRVGAFLCGKFFIFIRKFQNEFQTFADIS